MNHQEHSIDALIARIRQQAALHEPLPVGDMNFFKGEGSVLTLPPVEPLEIEVLHRGDTLDANDFFGMDNAAFIRLAYQLILRRPVDEEGFRNYTLELAQGGSRLTVLRVLRSSGEGMQQAVKLSGIPPALWVLDWVVKKFPTAEFPVRWIRLLEKRYLSRSDKLFEEKKRSLKAHTVILRYLSSWRVPLEITGGRTVVLEREVEQLRHQVKTLQQDLMLVREDSLHARRAGSSAGSASNVAADSKPATAHHINLDAYYVAFEDANRGTEDEFIAKLAVYTDLFDSLKLLGTAPLLDIGCGRGELLTYLRRQGITARGIDLNSAMVQVCQDAGHDVEQGDVIAYLRSVPDESLAAVTGFHIIEHLPFETLYLLFAECYRVLKRGGFILFETPNPENILVGSHTFYHDFTHRNPVTPSAIQFLAQYHNFTDRQIIRSNPYPSDAQVPGGDPLTQRVNGHLCGPQDFALLAFKPMLSAPEPA